MDILHKKMSFLKHNVMILSMTGFGRGCASTEVRKIIVEIKALNSKQLDLIIKLPSRYRIFEGELRNLLATKAERGKIEVVVYTEIIGSENFNMLNTSLIKQYKQDIEQLVRELAIPEPTDWMSMLLRMPDAMKGEDAELASEEEETFWKAVEEAVEHMLEFRKDEGAKLRDFFTGKIANIRSLLAEVGPFEESRVAKIKSRLLDQLSKLPEVEVDKGRLEQELIYYIEKLDISEEKQRLETHLNYFLTTMDGKETSDPSSKGKKLGFISQEIGREINTLGSKSNNAEMQIIVVKMKDELEQIKEQVLNVL